MQAEQLEDRLAPANFEVTSALDSGPGSLREAIAQANADSNADDDTIVFDAGLAGQTITLATGPLTLTDTSGMTTITGLGADQLTVSGNKASRVFEVQSGVTAAIGGLTVTGGSKTNNGGGIFNQGTLTVSNSTLSGNSASGGGGFGFGGGIFNSGGGTLTITGSTLSGNSADDGGGLFNQGTLAITGGTLNGNSANRGGGIFNSSIGTLTITGGTLSGNSAGLSGGGIINGGALSITDSTLSGNTAGDDGGGILNNGTLTLSNSTLSGNTADESGGGILNGGTLSVANSTLSGNAADLGGGISNLVGTLTLNNTIVANSPTGGDLDTGGVQIMGSHNLVESGDTAGLTNTITGDPLLGPLQNNGGPTFTHALLPGSPAINAGNNALAVDAGGNPLTTDQRGLSRFVGAVDIGAFEVQNRPPVIHNQTFHVSALFGTTVGTVQATDPDGQPLTFAIVGGNSTVLGAPFAIDPLTGRITVANRVALLLGPLSGGFDLVVRVTDSSGLFATAVIHIDVTLL